MRKPPTDLNIVRRFYDRWEPFEETRRQISDDLKELFAEAKAEGLNPKALRSAFKEQYRVENQTGDEAEKRLADGADFDLYLSALARVRESDDDFDPETGEFVTARIQSSSGALTAKTAVLITTPNPAPPASQDNGGGTAPTGAENALVGADTESTAAGKDRHGLNVSGSTPAGPDAPMQAGRAVATAEPTQGPSGTRSGYRAPPVDTQPARKGGSPDSHVTEAADASAAAPLPGDAQHTEPGKGSSGEMPGMAQRQAAGEASAPAFPAMPGSIRFESTPAIGVVWHEALRCFPERWGPDFGDLKDDIFANGVRVPIVMQGNVVIDGRARFLAARDLHIDYPVKEFDPGDNALTAIIRLNMASRNLNLVERQAIAKKLIKLAPEREADIVELMDLHQVREAAE